MSMQEVFQVSVVQDAPVAFDRNATLAKVIRLVHQAADLGSKLIVFPEVFFSGYPKRMDFGVQVGRRSPEGREWFRRYWEGSVETPGVETAALANLAKERQIYLVIGVTERSGSTLYCTVLGFGVDGQIILKHRKVMPTAMERVIWGFGDGSTLGVVPTPLGKLGAVICWENYMPLLRTAMYAQGIELYCAPTVDDRDTWLSTMQHIALEGRCFVVSACQFVCCSDYPGDYPPAAGNPADEVFIRGGSVIINPLGKILAGPIFDKACILSAQLNRADLVRSRFDLDVVGHYARPDLFQLKVNTSESKPVRFIIKDGIV